MTDVDDTDDRRSLSTAVVEAVADAEGVDATAIGEPLNDAIDPDALDALFNDAKGRVTFTYRGYLVTVNERGEVELESLE